MENVTRDKGPEGNETSMDQTPQPEEKAQVRKIVIKTTIRAGQGKNRYGSISILS